MDVTNLKKLMDVLSDAAGVAEKMVEEKGGLIAKLGHLLPLSSDAIILAGIDFKAMKAELSALDDAGKQAVIGELEAKLSLDDKDLQAKIEASLDLAVQVEDLVEKVIAFGKSLKAQPVAAAPVSA